jgi:hypothetical protein
MKQTILMVITLFCPSIYFGQLYDDIDGLATLRDSHLKIYSNTPKGNCPPVEDWPEIFFATGFNITTGVAFDGDHIWVVGQTDDQINKHSIETGELISSIPKEMVWAMNMTFARGSLWISDNFEQRIVQVDTADGSIISSFPSPGQEPRGIDWDGTYFWHNDLEEGMTFKLDSLGNVINSYPSVVGDNMDGLSFDGEHLWIHGEATCNKIDTATFEVLDCFIMPWGSALIGSSYDGQNLWIGSNWYDAVYYIDVSDYGVLDLDLEQNKSQIAYPNPFTETLFLKDISAQITGVRMFNSLGVEFKIELDRTANSIGIEVPGLKSGIYFIKIDEVGGKSKTLKVVKM